MIVYNLNCSAGHDFEAWFKDSKAFVSQQKGHKIGCPVCGETKVEKVPAAPRIGTGISKDPSFEESGMSAESGGANGPVNAGEASGEPSVPTGKAGQDIMSALNELHRHVKETCDDVGKDFAEEARKIHYGDAEERGIYGEATEDEAEELADEGVPFATVPKPPREDA
ncbi:MAG: DUF1178 family protein [Alphaproteobacteria bacterium]|jgi:hypothetical protein